MSLNDASTWQELLGFESDEERYDFEADKIQLSILSDIARCMEACGLSRTELASRLGVSKSYISQLFSADASLNLKTIAKLCGVFDVDASFEFRPRRRVPGVSGAAGSD